MRYEKVTIWTKKAFKEGEGKNKEDHKRRVRGEKGVGCPVRQSEEIIVIYEGASRGNYSCL